jgi:hypothetical protein
MASEHTMTGATVVADDLAARPERGLAVLELAQGELRSVEQVEQATIARVAAERGERVLRASPC